MIHKSFLIVSLCLSTLCLASEPISIPTLGGTVISGGGCNTSNTIVGSSFTKEGDLHAFTYDLSTKTLRDLGGLQDTSYFGFGINSHGDVVGSFASTTRASAWILGASQTAMQELGISGPITTSFGTLEPMSSFGMSINDAQEICGQQYTLLGNDTQIIRPMFYSQSTGMIDLGTPPDSTGEGAALCINNSSTVVGMTRRIDPATGFPVSRATMWMLGGMWKKSVQKIALLDGFEDAFNSMAVAINDKNEVVGTYQDAATNFRAFLWTPKDGLTDLGTLPGDNQAHAQAINNHGVIAGISYSNSEEPIARAFIWKEESGMIDLGIDSVGSVAAINDHGIVLINIGDGTELIAVDTKDL